MTVSSGVPSSADGIFSFINDTREFAKSGEGPPVIHCSAGVGRTGCFINIDIGMQEVSVVLDAIV